MGNRPTVQEPEIHDGREGDEIDLKHVSVSPVPAAGAPASAPDVKESKDVPAAQPLPAAQPAARSREEKRAPHMNGNGHAVSRTGASAFAFRSVVDSQPNPATSFVPPDDGKGKEGKDPKSPRRMKTLSADTGSGLGLSNGLQPGAAEKEEEKLLKQQLSEDDDQQPPDRPRVVAIPFGASGSGANEITVLVWSCVKAVAYLLFVLVFVLFVEKSTFNNFPCYQPDASLEFCLVRNDGGSPNCYFNSEPQCHNCTGLLVKGQINGCMVTYTATICLQQNTSSTGFKAQCQDDTLCATTNPQSELQKHAKYIAVILVVQMCVELIFAAGLGALSHYSTGEFYELGIVERVLVFCIKVAPYFQQILWIIQCGLLIFFGVIYGEQYISGDCVDLDQTQYRLYPISKALIIAVFVQLLVVFVAGSCIRTRCPLRGELFTPSAVADLEVPCNIDCRTCRDRSNRCCCCCMVGPLGSRGCYITPTCLKCCNACFDCSCGTFGNCCQACYRHRKFLGP